MTDFDAKHALIHHCLNEWPHQHRWEHISDERMEWIQLCHNEPVVAIPKAAWRRSIGKLKVSLDWKSEEGRQNLHLRIFLMFISSMAALRLAGRNRLEEWQKWRAITALSRQFVHKPTRPKPKEVNSNAIHHFRVEWMTYFHALCDVYNIPQDTFTDSLLIKWPMRHWNCFRNMSVRICIKK